MAWNNLEREKKVLFIAVFQKEQFLTVSCNIHEFYLHIFITLRKIALVLELENINILWFHIEMTITKVEKFENVIVNIG